jgi:hypothetical protein
MTRDDIIRLARECQDVPLDDSTTNIWVLFTEQLEHFAARVAAAEREECAELCEEMARRHNDIRRAALEVAAEWIRARGET